MGQLITVAIEAKIHARKRVHQDGSTVPLIFTPKENEAVQVIVNKYLEELQQELQHFINLTRSTNDSPSVRTDKHRTPHSDRET